MNLQSILFFGAATFATVFFVFYGMYGSGKVHKNSWIFPAILSLLFFSFSAVTIFSEGILGFYPEHTRTLWSSQIWFDLLIAAGIGWFLIVPRAKEQGMFLPIWGILILSTGSIGFTAMVARLQYLTARSIK